MFDKTYQATHPSMMDEIDGQTLCDLYQVRGLFLTDKISLHYSHNERMVVGGASPAERELRLPDQVEPVAGAPFLERRELGVINVGDGSGKVIVDGETFEMEPRDGLYVPMASKEVLFRSDNREYAGRVLSGIHSGPCALRAREDSDQGSGARKARFTRGVERPDDLQVCRSGNLSFGAIAAWINDSQSRQCLEHDAAAFA